MLRSVVSAFVLVSLCVLSAPVQAGYVPLLVNRTTGATIFDDNFEGATDDLNPVATVGTWSFNEFAVAPGPGDAVVRSSDWGTGGLGPNQGSKMLAFWAGSNITAVAAAGVAANSGANDVVQLSLAFRVKAGVENTVYLQNGTTDLLGIALWGPDAKADFPNQTNNGISVLSVDRQSWIGTGLVQDPNAWNTLTVTHTNGTDVWAISVNGSAAYSATGNAGVCNGFGIRNDNANVTAYFDAVNATATPEPSAIVLLLVGSLGLIAYAWRKRK